MLVTLLAMLMLMPGWGGPTHDDDGECHDGDDLACFECATVSDETSLDLPQKGLKRKIVRGHIYHFSADILT